MATTVKSTAKTASTNNGSTIKTAAQKPKAAPAKAAESKKSASNTSDSWQHIADQIKAFPSKRVWPD